MPSREQGISNARLVALLVTACAASIVVALLGWFLGAAPLSSVEPKGLFVNCGPALFGKPDPLPHPECAEAYFPLPFLSVMLMLMLSGAMGAVACAYLAVRRASSLPLLQRADGSAHRHAPLGG